jgi:hypothetical protein
MQRDKIEEDVSPKAGARSIRSEDSSLTRSEESTRGVTFRVVLLSLLLAGVFGYCIPIVDYKFKNTFLGAAHLPAGAVFALLVLLLGINPLLRLVSRRWTFSRNETLTVYITCLFSTLVPGRGGENFFIPNILASFYYGTSDNKWRDTLLPYLKPWFTPAVTSVNGHLEYNRAVVEPWYTGLRPGESIPWGAWMVPLIAWCSLILVLYFMLGCLGVMLRAQWAEREALAFPLLRLPLEMTEDLDHSRQAGASRTPAFFRNPLMWIGVGIAVFIQLLNGLNRYFPEVPVVPLSINTGPMLSEAPWNQIGGLQILIFPAVLGITYLLTSEVSFSLWFIFLFMKIQLVIAYMLGFMPNSLPSPLWTRGFAKGFIGYQQVGAYIAYVALLLWMGREHFRHIARRAFGRARATAAEKEEALSYPVAFWGFWGAFAFIVAWTVLAGVSLPAALLMWGAYLVVALGLTRVVAEGGLMMVHTGWMPLGPLAFLFGGGPNKIIDAASVAPASIIGGGLMMEMRGFLLPSFVQSFKLAHDRKIALKPLMALIALTTVVSFAIGVWVIIRLGYTTGGLQLQNWYVQGGATQPAQHALGIAKGLNDESYAANWGWVGFGALLTWGMMVARSRFLWFPLHPIGLLMFLPWALQTMWVSIMLGWLLKSLIQRFGGSDSYRNLVPAFLGLVLGDICMIVLWVVVDVWQGRTDHALLPF